MFAPCLLGSPGTPRHDPVRTGTTVVCRPTQNSTSWHYPIEINQKNRIEQRTLNPRVRGSSPGGAPGGLHVSVGLIFTFESDIPVCGLAWLGCRCAAGDYASLR